MVKQFSSILRFIFAMLLTTSTFIGILLCIRKQTYTWFNSSCRYELSADETYLLSKVENFVRISELHPVAVHNFAEMGHRLRTMLGWVQLAENLNSFGDPSGLARRLWNHSEQLAASQIPFLSGTGLSRPLHTALFSHETGTRGIVIPVGNKNFHLACHLIANIRDVLQSDLPIEIVFAGEVDLSKEHLYFILQSWSNIEAVDALAKLNDTTLELATSGFAIKPFAILVSRFEQVICADADAVFLQKPEKVFQEPGYNKTGVFLFKDRAVWAGQDRFHGSWWQAQFRELEPMSDNIQKSRAIQEGFSEHGESGVIALDKGRIGVSMALLHTCWQNTLDVRRSQTYVMANGDKESFWFGMEALGTAYAMEKTCAAALGHICQQGGDSPKQRICTTNIAHLDHEGRLLWWNGGLYQDKSANQLTFSTIPTAWMVDGEWHPAGPGSYSAMTGMNHHLISPREYEVMYETVLRARLLDRQQNVPSQDR